MHFYKDLLSGFTGRDQEVFISWSLGLSTLLLPGSPGCVATGPQFPRLCSRPTSEDEDGRAGSRAQPGAHAGEPGAHAGGLGTRAGGACVGCAEYVTGPPRLPAPLGLLRRARAPPRAPPRPPHPLRALGRARAGAGGGGRGRWTPKGRGGPGPARPGRPRAAAGAPRVRPGRRRRRRRGL